MTNQIDEVNSTAVSPYEDQLCAVCKYSIDSEGLCVMDAAHETKGVIVRTFPDVINEWTEELLRENQKATLEQVALILRLGTLGQRLIFEANAVGQNEALRMLKQARES